ncbi:hypothetical protein CIT292_10385 [Citrobacter youngae ATCC 29220]|uniref:Uncharacterized protein n=1 Tax=Citrobacter youngae ATCC 29220 TaxID=500640 RepID=D4BIL8_9ENTR|nr:hypothetical protein CIT292_10385 [Citrobacter youngae ATCC 29220]
MKSFILSIRWIWFILSIFILYASFFRLYQLDSSYDTSELISIMMYGMILISLPIGVAFAIILAFILLIFNIIFPSIENKYFLAFIIWGWFLFGGYIQWFFLIDKIISKITPS